MWACGGRAPASAAKLRYHAPMPRRRVKLVHTSDVHLDGRFAHELPGGYRNPAERAFAAVVDSVLAEAADLLLIAGDLFDNSRVGEADFAFVAEQLARVACPVIALPGNHDVHDERSVWRRIAARDAHQHVYLLLDTAGASLDFPDLGVRVWGRAMVEHTPDNEPLADTPARRDGVWNIGMAHGLVVDERAGIGSSQITRAEIRGSGFDYLALGHVHVWSDVSEGDTAACYPGSPVAGYASDRGGHVAVAILCPERGVEVSPRLVDARDADAAGVVGFG